LNELVVLGLRFVISYLVPCNLPATRRSLYTAIHSCYNHGMRQRLTTVLLCTGLLLAACSADGVTPDGAQPTPVPTRALLEYRSPTPTPDYTATPRRLQPTVPALPTATPFLYTVVEKDTMIGIAVKFNLTLEDLLAANPEVDPRFLSVDTVLVIPTGEGEVVNLPTPTPVAVMFSEPVCYLNAAGGLWCLVAAENNAQSALENLSAKIYLYSAQGDVLESQIAMAPLNVLGMGEKLALAAYFPPPLPVWSFAQAQLLTALPVADGDARYLRLEVNDLEVDIQEDGVSAQISGELNLSDREQTAATVWVAAVAYDRNDTVVGFRRWESTAELSGAAGLRFEFQVYSLDTPIARVDVFPEARP
jgi:LysM repeat protein